MKKTYRKTATVQAEQWTDPDNPPEGVCMDSPLCQQRAYPHVHSKEGVVPAQPGNYIATGIDGERWPIDASIFERTYEEVGLCRCDAGPAHDPSRHVWEEYEYDQPARRVKTHRVSGLEPA